MQRAAFVGNQKRLTRGFCDVKVASQYTKISRFRPKINDVVRLRVSMYYHGYSTYKQAAFTKVSWVYGDLLRQNAYVPEKERTGKICRRLRQSSIGLEKEQNRAKKLRILQRLHQFFDRRKVEVFL